MGLDDVDLGGGESRVRERLPDDAALGWTVRCCQTVGGAVGVHRGAADHGQDLVAVASRLGQPLQQDEADALAPPGAVGGFGEGLAAAVGREPALPAELDERRRVGHHGDATRDGEGALAATQALGGDVQCHQGRRARGVDGHRRADEAEAVGDPPGEDAVGGAGDDESVAVTGADRGRAVAGGRRAHVHPGPALPLGTRVDPGAFEHLPGRLQQQALLGVHHHRLAWRDPEDGRIEEVGVVQETPVRGDVLAAEPRLPAPAGRVGGDRVGAVQDQPPQVLRGLGSPGIPATHPDHGDGLGPRRPEPLVLLAQAVVLDER